MGLALKKASFEKVEVHPLNKKELEFSDYKKVPVYVDTHGKQVNDSNVILKHLDKEFPQGPQLAAPAGSEESRVQEQWLQWSECYVKAVPPLIYDTIPNSLKAFNYITEQGKFSTFEKLKVKYAGALVMKLVAKKSKKTQNIDDPRAHIKTLIQEWATAVGSNPFRGGATPDITDAAVYGVTLSVKGLPAYSVMTEVPAFAAWMQRMSEQTHL